MVQQKNYGIIIIREREFLKVMGTGPTHRPNKTDTIIHHTAVCKCLCVFLHNSINNEFTVVQSQVSLDL